MHVNVWRSYSLTIAQHPEVQPGMEGVVSAYLSLLTRATNVAMELEAPVGLEPWGREIGRAEQQINRTWKKVEIEALQYGVTQTPVQVEAP